ncbi:type III pantothenate kinase [bacterium]|nr:type III pantothenate kinase [bacterium]
MLAVIDIGNTQICLGIFNQKRLVKEFRLPTNRRITADELDLALSGLIKGREIDRACVGVVIASVVPELDTRMISAAHSCFGVPVLMISPEMSLPVKNVYRPPGAVGTDRLMNAVAAIYEFGSPVI